MKKKFSRIGILGFPRYSSDFLTHEILYNWLIKIGYQVIIVDTIVHKLSLKNPNTGTISKIGSSCSLAIVIGGDGNMLGVTRILSNYDIKVVGINLGKLGFLTDLNPKNMFKELFKILSGKYLLENRFTLEVIVYRNSVKFKKSKAVNEVVLHSKKVAHMINFEVYINERFSFSQRADGLIVSTSTGSTGYSLSAGGPILSTTLEAMVLVPMFPQTLSARPLVIDNKSSIILKFLDANSNLKISCDSQITFSIKSNDTVLIKKSKTFIKLVHPEHYNYFDILNKKLNWSKNVLIN